ncbi:hypothetical protein FRB95_000276 [Tulasnella sp. JGI-2019a]|nr:hypothetical protein FRB95_000276 [Tulasnella sp. JGI-2019a]
MTRITNAGLSRGYVKAGFYSFTAGDKAGTRDVLQKGESAKRKTAEDQSDDLQRPSKKRRPNRKEGGGNSTPECPLCQKKGHEASECRKADKQAKGATAELATAVANDGGICYRCGSKRHRLKACKKRKDPTNLHPFATCSICTNKGHLTSACPKNPKRNKELAKPECCKLCGGTVHVAKDCPMHGPERLEETRNGDIFLGPDPTLTAADEDDFHILRRRHDEVTRDEVTEQRMQALNEAAAKASQRRAAAVKQSVSIKKAKVVTF